MLTLEVYTEEEITTFISKLIYDHNEFRYLRDELRENGVLNRLLGNLIEGHYNDDVMNLEAMIANIFRIF